jgi:hypothetical protein
MKYTEAWASVVSQNLNLKIVTGILGVLSLVLGMTTLKLTFKDSVIIDRGCYSKVAAPVKDEHSKTEIEAFLKEALSQRFDSLVQPIDGLLSPDELVLRATEQKEFDSRGMKQRLVINQVTEDSGGFKVEADRIISVGEVRSAFKFPLLAKLESKSRSYSNPYGLLLVTVKQVEDKSQAKDKK